LQYLFETMDADDSLLIVDDVYSTGRNVEAVIDRLQKKTRRNMPEDVRIAAPYYRYQPGSSCRVPNFFLHQYSEWLVLPYELTGLSDTEIAANKPWIKPLLDELESLRGEA
jgi:hypoxanthine phosphoribosyltransferase